MHRSRVLTAIAACLLVLVAGCSSGGQSQPPSPSLHGGNLVFDFATAPLDLDPSTSGDNATSMQMWNAWFQYLVQPNSPGPGYAPMLAASYSISADIVPIGEDADGHIDAGELREQLSRYAGRPLLIGSFSAASNVTGILSDTSAVARLLHAHGALSFWDYAAAGPYLPIRMAESRPGAGDHKDAVFLSPHKFPGGPVAREEGAAPRPSWNRSGPGWCSA